MGNKKFKAMKRKVTPKGVNILERGNIVSKNGRLIGPGGKFTDDEVTAERLKELRDKKLVRGVLTTEEKGTFTK